VPRSGRRAVAGSGRSRFDPFLIDRVAESGRSRRQGCRCIGLAAAHLSGALILPTIPQSLAIPPVGG
jgi:hypothetical protein